MRENSGHALYYSDALIDSLQLRWGEGFLSPGGEEELAALMRGVDIAGQTGLDLGCGIGGFDRLLAQWDVACAEDALETQEALGDRMKIATVLQHCPQSCRLQVQFAATSAGGNYSQFRAVLGTHLRMGHSYTRSCAVNNGAIPIDVGAINGS